MKVKISPYYIAHTWSAIIRRNWPWNLRYLFATAKEKSIRIHAIVNGTANERYPVKDQRWPRPVQDAIQELVDNIKCNCSQKSQQAISPDG